MRLAILSLFASVALAGQLQVIDLEGKAHAFQQLQGNTTVVLFMATRCPVSNAYNERMEQLYKDYNPRGVNFVFLNANATEPLAEIAEHAKKQGFSFPIYKDVNNAVADKFSASATPESFVIDHAGIVRYHGAIDDSQNPARVKSKSLRDALDALLRGADVPKSETKAFGCSIKRVRK